MKDNNSLVSICTTLFNVERYVHRFLDSSLAQTYRNIEVVLVDDDSADNSEMIIKEYTSRDPRVRYFKNSSRIGFTKSLEKLFKVAKGEYVVFLGTDDWFARDFIEEGMRVFGENQDIAAVVPKLINFKEISHNKFELTSELTFPTGIYKSEWFIKRLYRTAIGVSSHLALLRREDMVSHMDSYIKNYCEDPDIPQELREFYWRGYAYDSLFFLEILTKYKKFFWDESLVCIKILHSENVVFKSLKHDSVSGILKSYYYLLLAYKTFYKSKWSNFYFGMKIYMALEALSTSLISFLKGGFRPSFLNFSKSKEQALEFFEDFSFFEILLTLIFLIPRIIFRFFVGAIRKFFSGHKRLDTSRVFIKNYFLDTEGRFRV